MLEVTRFLEVFFVSRKLKFWDIIIGSGYTVVYLNAHF